MKLWLAMVVLLMSLTLNAYQSHQNIQLQDTNQTLSARFFTALQFWKQTIDERDALKRKKTTRCDRA